MGLLQGDWNGYHKINGILYLVTCTETAYIPGLSVNILSMTRGLTKGSNMTSEKESIVIKKNATILKFEVWIHHGNGDGYLLATRN